MAKDRIPGLYSLSELPEWTVEDIRRFKAHRAHRRRLRAKEEEERRRQDAEENRRRISNGAAMLTVETSQFADPEIEARAWAVGYFQEKQDELTREGSKNYPAKEYARYLTRQYDEHRRDPKSSRLRGDFTDPHFENMSELIEFCVFMIERGEPLPEYLRKFVAGVLREN
jgi:hypothetical protein